MDTKFKYIFNKHLDDSRWKHLVNVDLCKPGPPHPCGDYQADRTNFIKFMDTHYDKVKYSIRWTDYGVDVRFESDADAASFLMLHT